MQRYDAKRHEAIFTEQEPLDVSAWQKGVKGYCVKEVRAGSQLALAFYPIWPTRAEATRAKKNASKKAVEDVNRRNARNQAVWMINENFTAEDIALDLTYRPGELPTLEEARADIRAYIREIQRIRKKRGLPPLRYFYVIEHADEDGRKKRVHHHIILSGDMERDELERIWGKGRSNSRRLQPDEFGLSGIASYIVKARRDTRNAKRWAYSRNLRQPDIRRRQSLPGGRRLNQKLIGELAKHDVEAIQKTYKDYTFTDMEVKYSDYVSGAYVYIRMRRAGGWEWRE